MDSDKQSSHYKFNKLSWELRSTEKERVVFTNKLSCAKSEQERQVYLKCIQRLEERSLIQLQRLNDHVQFGYDWMPSLFGN